MHEFDPMGHLPRPPSREEVTGLRILRRPDGQAAPPNPQTMAAALKRDPARRGELEDHLLRRWRLREEEIEEALPRVSMFDQVISAIEAQEHKRDNYTYDYDAFQECW